MIVKDPEIYLKSILDSIELIEKRTKNKTREQFIDSIDLQDMVIRRLELIGEAVRQLPVEFRKEHVVINWQDPAGMRSVLIHGYLDVDLNVVWDTVVKDLPTFKNQIASLFKKLGIS
ncbi:MAG: DUF86 domain-containing protein [Candidatus Shapirobacteria bacterium]|jgi:uncharacterized protein with HEPN domain